MLTRASTLYALLLIALPGCTEAPGPAGPPTPPIDAATPPPDVTVDAAPIRIVALEPRIEITIPDAGVEVVEVKKPAATAKRRKRRRARRGDKPVTARPRPTPLSTIRANMRDIEHCYGRVALKDPSVRGRIVVQWTLGRDGTPTGTAILTDTLSDKSVGACIKKRARRWKFPAPEGGVSVVKYPFDLKVQ